MGTSVAARANTTKTVNGTAWLRNQTKKIGDGTELAVDPEVAAGVGVEAWLQEHGVQYAPPAQIPMSIIDEKRSRGNQARRDSVINESVDRFAAAMREANSAFPPIVCYPDGGKLVIIDGNNRQAAAKRVGRDTVLGIIIAEDTPSEVILALTIDANTRHGVTPDLGWRVEQALLLCATGYSDQDAARKAGLSVSQLRNARHAKDSDERARSMSIRGFDSLPTSTKVVLNPVKDDPAFYQLSKLAISTGMITDEVRDVTRVLRGLGTEAARMEYIASVAKVRTTQVTTNRRPVGQKVGAHSRLHSPKASLLAGFGKITAVKPADLARQVVTAHDRDIILKRVEDAERTLKLIRASLGALDLDDTPAEA